MKQTTLEGKGGSKWLVVDLTEDIIKAEYVPPMDHILVTYKNGHLSVWDFPEGYKTLIGFAKDLTAVDWQHIVDTVDYPGEPPMYKNYQYTGTLLEGEWIASTDPVKSGLSWLPKDYVNPIILKIL